MCCSKGHQFWFLGLPGLVPAAVFNLTWVTSGIKNQYGAASIFVPDKDENVKTCTEKPIQLEPTKVSKHFCRCFGHSNFFSLNVFGVISWILWSFTNFLLCSTEHSEKSCITHLFVMAGSAVNFIRKTVWLSMRLPLGLHQRSKVFNQHHESESFQHKGNTG
jgi:hypothetical protein